MKSIRYFIDVWSLFSEQYTGIQNVNYQIVKYFYEKLGNKITYFSGKNIVHKSIIQRIIQNKSGRGFVGHQENSYSAEQSLEEYLVSPEDYTVAVFPCVKDFYRIFDYEIQIIYDLTFLLAPEFHIEENIRLHSSRLEKSLLTNDLNVCISESTKEDILTYMSVSENKAIVSHLGYDSVSLEKENGYKDIVNSHKVEPFLLILGTIEPRKNIQLVLKFIEQNIEVLKRYRFIFIGKNGWGNPFNDYLDQFNISAKLKEKRIKHLTYVSEDEKNILLMTAQFLIFPSIYEGFGLPVLEAMSFGCPVLASVSSSIPEIGGDILQYFDPFSLKSFTIAFRELENRLRNNNDEIKKKSIERASKFSWNLFVERIIERVNVDLPSRT